MLQLDNNDLEKYKGDMEKHNNDLEKYSDDVEKNNDYLEKDQGHNPENGPKNLLSDPKSSLDNDMGYDSEKKLRSPSEKNSMVSVETIDQRQLENVLKIHLCKRSVEITEGQLSGTVLNSWHTMKQRSLLF